MNSQKSKRNYNKKLKILFCCDNMRLETSEVYLLNGGSMYVRSEVTSSTKNSSTLRKSVCK